MASFFWRKRYISFGSDFESNDDMDDEDLENLHQYREPSISSPLRPKTRKTSPSTRTTTQPSQNLQENTMTGEELADAELRWDREEVPHVWQF